MADLMDWRKLLSTVRCRELFGGPASFRSSGEVRTEFERDYGRAVFSTPIRRLQDKAQVFPSDPNDVVRTRLTHSQEVSSVARDLGRSAARWLQGEEHITSLDLIDAIEAIAATCGMIHDLGNPTFGHSGEGAIRDWFVKRGIGTDGQKNELLDFGELSTSVRRNQLEADFRHFEGNAQTLRLVSKLQVLTDMYGLNFTCGTLSVACKYTAASDEMTDTLKEFKKPGYFASENDLIDKIREATGTGTARNPITYLVEASDDIVYSTVDIEDAIKKGVLRWDTIEEELKSKVDPDILNPILNH